jgi:hypothetical protein
VQERVKSFRFVPDILMNMGSDKRPKSLFAEDLHLACGTVQNLSSVEGHDYGGGKHAADEELSYSLRVKPDRRRVKAAYPPHLDRRRTRS